MDEGALLLHAQQHGFGAVYASSADFRQVYGDQVRAVENLPVHLLERGRELPYPQLHSACLAGDTELVAALLSLDVGPDIYPCLDDDEDDTPLEWLAEECGMEFTLRIQIAQLLIDAEAHLDEALFRAVENDDEAFAKFLRERGANDEV
jgi:hypothetical protein